MAKPPPTPPNTLDYDTPEPPPSKNKGWMVVLRIFAGTAAAFLSVSGGYWLAHATAAPANWFVPPAVVFVFFLFVSLKYRRFGYVTGFVLAPFIATTLMLFLALIVCGVGGLQIK